DAGPGAAAFAAFASQLLDATRQNPRRSTMADVPVQRVSRGPRAAPPRLAMVRSWFARHGEGVVVSVIALFILAAVVSGLGWLTFGVLAHQIARLDGVFRDHANWFAAGAVIALIYGAV